MKSIFYDIVKLTLKRTLLPEKKAAFKSKEISQSVSKRKNTVNRGGNLQKLAKGGSFKVNCCLK